MSIHKPTKVICYFIKWREWDGEYWTGWINCYCTDDPFILFPAPKYQVRVLHSTFTDGA